MRLPGALQVRGAREAAGFHPVSSGFVGTGQCILCVHTVCVWTVRVDALGVCIHVCIYRQCIYINRW